MWIVLMTLVSSMDCVLAGLSYATRGIRIPFLSKMILFLTALLVGCLASAASAAMASLIPPNVGDILGRIVLVLLALFMLLSAYIDKKPRESDRNTSAVHKKNVPDSEQPKTLFKLVLKSAGITIQIFKNPEDADIDRSGRIDPAESILLSIALTLDSVGLILCGALINQTSILLPVALSIGQLLGLILGERFGGYVKKRLNHKVIKYLPALMLFLIAGIEFMR